MSENKMKLIPNRKMNTNVGTLLNDNATKWQNEWNEMKWKEEKEKRKTEYRYNERKKKKPSKNKTTNKKKSKHARTTMQACNINEK